MRVLYAIQAYFPALGGAEWCAKNVCERLVAEFGDSVRVFASAGYNCEVFARSGKQMEAGESVINGVQVRRFRVRSPLGRGRYVAARIARAMRLPGADHLRTLAAGPYLEGFEKALMASDAEVFAAGSLPYRHLYITANNARKLNRPYILNPCYHVGDDFWFGGNDQVSLLKDADAYVANTEFEKKFAIELGVREDRIFVAGNGIDVQRHQNADGAALRNKLGVGQAPLIGFVGLHSKRKGLDLLIAAMRRVWEKVPDAHLLIAGGRTSYSAELDRMINLLPSRQAEQIKLLHDFTEEQKSAVFAAIDILAFPSRFESFGIVTLEAWASQKPVVAFRGEAIASVIEHGKDGRLARAGESESFAEELLTLIQNSELRVALGAAGYVKARTRYSWSAIAGAYRQAMEYALGIGHSVEKVGIAG